MAAVVGLHSDQLAIMTGAAKDLFRIRLKRGKRAFWDQSDRNLLCNATVCKTRSSFLEAHVTPRNDVGRNLCTLGRAAANREFPQGPGHIHTPGGRPVGAA